MAGGAGDGSGAGEWLHALVSELYPICRSITGAGVRETLERVKAHVPIDIVEVPSGTPVFDWTVPLEWNISDAFVADESGARVIDFKASNLHVLNYSVPVDREVSLAELKEHVSSLPDRPDAVPYRTSYYREAWGFCASQRVVDTLADERYHVRIDSSLTDGHLSYGELLLPGSEPDEVLITTHVCHPSMANDNLSGIAVATMLARRLGDRPHRYSYRFLFIPGTIGSITWLATNGDVVPRIRHGVVVAGVGDGGPFTWKRSRRGSTEVDRAAEHVLARAGAHEVVDFYPYGYDERQFCSPGFDLAVGRFSRSMHGRYPEYHTSLDDLGFVSAENLEASLDALEAIVDVLEGNATYRNTNPYCEPQLGKRGLYSAIGGQIDQASVEMGLLWVLNQSDGTASLLDIAERADLPFPVIRRAADALLAHGLLDPVAGGAEPAE